MLDVHQRQHTCLNTLCERSYSQDAIMTLLTRILAEHHLISNSQLWLWSCRERRRGPWMRQLRGCVELHGRDRAFSATRGVSRGTHSRRPTAPGPTGSTPATTSFPVLWAVPGCCRVLWCWGVHRPFAAACQAHTVNLPLSTPPLGKSELFWV